VPGYSILGELGGGGRGVVYKALDLRLSRLVALKMIVSSRYSAPEELNRMRKEAEALARLRHPNVVQIYDIGEHDGRPGGPGRLLTRGSHRPVRARISAYGSSDHGLAA